MARSNVMWVEKYRPSKLTDLINQKETVSSLKSLLKNQSEMPHLLFSGSAGVGKTTTALCLSEKFLVNDSMIMFWSLMHQMNVE